MNLSKEQIKHFKKKLIELRNNIVRSVQEIKEEVKNNEESKGYSQHQADEGTDYFDKTISLELSNKEMNILGSIPMENKWAQYYLVQISKYETQQINKDSLILKLNHSVFRSTNTKFIAW